jgi:hypothetical protein
MFAVPTVHAEEDAIGPYITGPFDGGIPAGAPPPREPTDAGSGGTCVTATCISFVTLGYCIVAIALVVSYKKYRPRDRSKRFDEEICREEDVVGLADDETEVMNPVFEGGFRAGGSSNAGRSSSGRSSARGLFA